MDIKSGDNVYRATPANAVIFTGETLIQGLYIDLDDDYLFISDEIPNYPEVALTAKYEGIPVYDLDTYDPTAPPFCYIINFMCRMFAQEVEIICGEN